MMKQFVCLFLIMLVIVSSFPAIANEANEIWKLGDNSIQVYENEYISMAWNGFKIIDTTKEIVSPNIIIVNNSDKALSVKPELLYLNNSMLNLSNFDKITLGGKMQASVSAINKWLIEIGALKDVYSFDKIENLTLIFDILKGSDIVVDDEYIDIHMDVSLAPLMNDLTWYHHKGDDSVHFTVVDFIEKDYPIYTVTVATFIDNSIDFYSADVDLGMNVESYRKLHSLPEDETVPVIWDGKSFSVNFATNKADMMTVTLTVKIGVVERTVTAEISLKKGSAPKKEDATQPKETEKPTPKPTATVKPTVQPTATVSKKEYSENECKEIALAYMKEHIHSYLKNPASLQIVSVSGGKTEGSEYLFVINYTAMNSFGGYTPGTYYCTVDYLTGEVTMGGTI